MTSKMAEWVVNGPDGKVGIGTDQEVTPTQALLLTALMLAGARNFSTSIKLADAVPHARAHAGAFDGVDLEGLDDRKCAEKLRGYSKGLLKNGLVNQYDRDGAVFCASVGVGFVDAASVQKKHAETEDSNLVSVAKPRGGSKGERGGGRARTPRVAGTGTWRDGLPQKKVEEFETWAPDFARRVVQEVEPVKKLIEGGDLTFDQLKESLCSRWVKAGGGVTEAKLLKAIREEQAA